MSRIEHQTFPSTFRNLINMPISTVDAKRRVVLPSARPGDVFDIQSQGEGRLLLVRLEPPTPGPRMSMARCLEAIAAAPLQPKMTWDSLKAVAREP
jgi:bifunctional DNA-binding transcriptional regulator/antitoxin component of YhaV-PrlF toxin-antitoxin module